MSMVFDSSEYNFVRFKAELIGDVWQLYKEVFAEDPSRHSFWKKYDTLIFGCNPVGHLAYDRAGRAAAFYGVFPVFCERRGQTILAAQSGDTMTHPKHRGRGLFVRLAKATYDSCRVEGIRFVFGFPNQKSYHGLVSSLGWKDVGRLRVYRIPTFSLPVGRLGLGRLHRVFGPLYRRYVHEVLRTKSGTNIPFSENSASDGRAIIVKRCPELFSYKRYSESHFVEVNGVLVWLKVDGYQLSVGDVNSLESEDYEKALIGLRRVAFVLGTQTIMFATSIRSPLDKWLATKARYQQEWPVCVLDLGSGLDLGNVSFGLADLDTF